MPKPPYIRDTDGSTRQGKTAHPRDFSAIAVEERDLSFIRVDHQLRFQFGGTEIVIESPFTLVSDGEAHELDPGQRAALGPVLALYPDALLALAVGTDGDLRLGFESGASLTVPPDPHFEAWEVSGPGTRLIVCAPGGHALSVWA